MFKKCCIPDRDVEVKNLLLISIEAQLIKEPHNKYKYMNKVIILIFCKLISLGLLGQEKEIITENNKDTCLNGVIVSFSHVKTIYTIQHTVDSNGIAYVFYPNASIRAVIYYKDDTISKKIGWHQNGFKSYEYNYSNGKIEGQVKRYYSTGELASLEFYKDGWMEGKQVFYYKNGRVKKTENYKKGNLL